MVGAGCGGALLGARLAASGFRVLLIDRRREEEIGPESCDMVEWDSFEAAGIEPPDTPEARQWIEGLRVLSADATAEISIPEYPYRSVDRRLLAGRLLRLAEASGAEIRDQCTAAGVGMEEGRVTGVVTDRGIIYCRLAVDASGLDRVLCRDMPRGTGIARRLRTGDHLSVYKEMRECEPGQLEEDDHRTGYPTYFLGRYGGYSWIHVCENNEVEIGTAVQDVPGAPDSREVVLGYIRSSPWVGEKVIYRRGGRIPTRRPLSTMVSSGLMVIGDAACQATPLLGRGVGGALTGAKLAAEAAAFALEETDTTISGLWSYNSGYMRDRGAHMAALDCMRIFLQNLPEKDLNWSLSRGIVGERELTSTLSGRFEIPSTQMKLKSLIKGIWEAPLLMRFENALKKSREVLDLYRQYPLEYDAPRYVEWEQEAGFLFEDIERV